MLQIHPEEEVAEEEEEEEETSEKRGADNLTNPIFIAHIAINMDMMHPNAGHLGIKLSSKEIKKKVKLMTKTKVKHLNLLIIF